jgi:hypothetical protein
MAKKPSHSRPLSPAQAPDPARVYERAKPEKEAGMGRLDNNVSIPERSADKMEQAVKQKQPLRQINAEDVVNDRAGHQADGASIQSRPAEQPDHSMHEEEPMGADQAPMDIKNPREKRHPRTEGKGGTP